MSRFVFELAKESDDSSLRKILYENPMPGEIKLTFRRDPNYFYALGTEGKESQVVVGRDSLTNNIIGFGARSLKPVYINGKPEEIGYLNHLRIDKPYRGGTALARGYKFLKQLHKDNKVHGYLTTIVEDNKYAMNALTRKRAGLPYYRDMGLYYSFAVPVSRKRRKANFTFDIRRGSESQIGEIVEFINKTGPGKQFYPLYAKDDFISRDGLTRDFNIGDFYVALKNDKIAGVLGKWDQREFKQTVVAGYGPFMNIARPVYNLWAKAAGLSALPPAGSELNYFYVSFIAVESNDRRVFSELLNFLHNDFALGQYSYFMVGLHSRDPLIESLKSFPAVKYKSRLYFVHWEDGEDFFKSLDNRTPYLEVGAL